MKKLGLLGIILGVVLSYALTVSAMDMGGMDHSKMDQSKEMDHDKMAAKDENVVEKDGYKVKFDFIDLKKKMKKMNMGDMDMGGKTHHLMVFVTDADGKSVTDAKVKYKIFSPSKKESEAMAMRMGKGFGADINLSEKGKHGIAVMLKIGDKKVLVKIPKEIK